MKKLLLFLALAILPCLAFSQGIMSVGDFLKLRQSVSAQNSQTSEILSKNGYVKSYQKSQTEFYFYKNCRLQIAPENYQGIEIEASPMNEKATFICISTNPYGGYISVTSYGKANFNKWVAQIKALGYRNNGNGGEGNQGRDWGYSKRGAPDLSIWNDYGNTYVLSVEY
jgi:hypothetical protein